MDQREAYRLEEPDLEEVSLQESHLSGARHLAVLRPAAHPPEALRRARSPLLTQQQSGRLAAWLQAVGRPSAVRQVEMTLLEAPLPVVPEEPHLEEMSLQSVPQGVVRLPVQHKERQRQWVVHPPVGLPEEPNPEGMSLEEVRQRMVPPPVADRSEVPQHRLEAEVLQGRQEEVVSQHRPEAEVLQCRPEAELLQCRPEEALPQCRPEEEAPHRRPMEEVVLHRHPMEEALHRHPAEEAVLRRRPMEVVHRHHPAAEGIAHTRKRRSAETR